jgi:uncharacterized lipoprotein NlpE involved in copper resistance
MNKGFLAIISAIFLLNFVSCASMQDNINAKDTLDWAGVYTGIIPAADAEGIDAKITLTSEGTYLVSYRYIGKSNQLYTSTGPFKWNDKGNIITLNNKDVPPHYLVGKGTLTQLDMKGKVITGKLAANYVLKKQ